MFVIALALPSSSATASPSNDDLTQPEPPRRFQDRTLEISLSGHARRGFGSQSSQSSPSASFLPSTPLPIERTHAVRCQWGGGREKGEVDEKLQLHDDSVSNFFMCAHCYFVPCALCSGGDNGRKGLYLLLGCLDARIKSIWFALKGAFLLHGQRCVDLYFTIRGCRSWVEHDLPRRCEQAGRQRGCVTCLLVSAGDPVRGKRKMVR